MKTQINEIKRMQHLAGLISESQLDEALNKDMRQFGQDLEKRLKEAGFLTMIAFHPKYFTDQQKEEIKADPKKVGLYVILEPQYQSLQLRGNAKSAKELEKIINRFQVSDWSGPKMEFGSGWDAKTKQVVGALNPGDIIGGNKGVNGQYYDANFVRYAVVDTKVKTSQGGKETTTSSKTASMSQPQPQAESLEEAPSTPSDVAALSKAQTSASTVTSKAKAINSIQEFPGAFEQWFKTLGFQPGKITKSTVRAEVEKVLTKLGYK